MKQPIRSSKYFLLAAFLALTFLSKFSYSQSFFGVSSNPADGNPKTGPTTIVSFPPSMVTNDLVIIYAEYRGTGVTLSVSTTGGQSWNTALTNNGSTQTYAIFWCTFNGSWATNPAVTVSGGGTNALTAVMYVFTPSNSNNVWGVNVTSTTAASGTNPNTITGVTTTMPNTVSMAFWCSAASNTWGTLSGAGWSNSGLSAQYRNTTTGQSQTAAYNIQATAGATGNVSQTQSATTTALKSIVSWNELSNDDCSGTVSLTPGSSCTNTAGNVVGATLSSGVPLPTCGTPVYDVWYSFVAQATIQTVTLSSIGANFTNPGIQLLSGSCGSLTTVGCNAGSALTVSGLTIGATYYVRVYSTDPVPATSGTFNICITNVPANDDCSAPVSLTSSTSCVNTAGTLVNATYATISGACGSSSGNRNDVWYSFVAQTTNPSIKLTSGPSDISVQLFSGSCASPTSVQCVTTTSTTATLNATGLTAGTTYLVRVFSNNNTAGTFNICITDPAPANNACSGAVTLTSGTSCANTAGTVYAATNSGVSITADCAGTVVYDVWYKFVAQTPNPTISLSSIGSDFTNPALELMSGSCGGLTALYCGTTSIAADFLTPNTTYYIRVYSSSGTAPASATNAGFNICIVDPVSSPPFNDECVNAINVPIWNTCNNVNGNIAGATLSSGVSLQSPCTGTVAYDVWYKFTAVTNNASTIALTSIGSNFTSPGLQVFSGSCGSLTSIACSNTTSVTTPALTTGTVYYVRVFSTAGPAPNGNARFNICATTTNAPVRFGNSYVNISKKTTGGVVEPGDTLEIRMTINHTSGTMYHLRFVDNLPTHTGILPASYDSVRIITNEGLTYKNYSLGAGDDAATYTATPGAGEYNIRLNLGFGGISPGIPIDNTATESASAIGRMSSADKPVGGGGLLFAISYRVVVTGNVGDTIVLNPAEFLYQTASTGQPDITLTATPYKILISNPLTLCTNSIGLNNAVENGGTFGSGNTLNRSTDLTTPIAGYTFIPDVSPFNVIGDGRYGILKNLSPQSGTQRLARRMNNCNTPTTLMPTDQYSCSNRMFTGFWYVDGDHSGTNNSIGNSPPDESTPGGYMLVVNADYPASEVYRQTITNLCPNTYYEFSAWIRNICTVCGIDSLGHQFAASNIPADKNGYPGVLPNLTFALNNLDYYNTGEVDTLGWLKKGFVFKTDTNQTTATFSIRNNAQGGGGNDWALDDIAIATCLPTMQYSPSINPMVCRGNSLDIYDTVRSYFDNYTNYKWERSTDGGNNWSDITSSVDTSLTVNGSTYQFITKYTIPVGQTTLANANDLYRVVVATSSMNLSNSSCLYTDASSIITLTVNDCGPVLGIDLLSFSGKLNNGNANLQWVTSKEDEPVSFNVEKSIDGVNFTSIATVKGKGNSSTENNFYQFTDPATISDKAWYRILMYNDLNHKKYSRIILLNEKTDEFSLTNVINPFSTELDFEVSSPENSRVDAILTNLLGKPVRKESYNVYAGSNSLMIPDTDDLPPGMYILQVRNNDKIINRKVMKK